MVAAGPKPASAQVSSLMSSILSTFEQILADAVRPINFIEKAGSKSTNSTDLLFSISLCNLTASFSDCNASIIISNGSSYRSKIEYTFSFSTVRGPRPLILREAAKCSIFLLVLPLQSEL